MKNKFATWLNWNHKNFGKKVAAEYFVVYTELAQNTSGLDDIWMGEGERILEWTSRSSVVDGGTVIYMKFGRKESLIATWLKLTWFSPLWTDQLRHGQHF